MVRHGQSRRRHEGLGAPDGGDVEAQGSHVRGWAREANTNVHTQRKQTRRIRTRIADASVSRDACFNLVTSPLFASHSHPDRV